MLKKSFIVKGVLLAVISLFFVCKSSEQKPQKTTEKPMLVEERAIYYTIIVSLDDNTALAKAQLDKMTIDLIYAYVCGCFFKNQENGDVQLLGSQSLDQTQYQKLQVKREIKKNAQNEYLLESGKLIYQGIKNNSAKKIKIVDKGKNIKLILNKLMIDAIRNNTQKNSSGKIYLSGDFICKISNNELTVSSTFIITQD